MVEDDADLQAAIREALQDLGFVVRCASDGQSALEVLRKRKPDVIVLDLNLPVIDGWEFRVRQRLDPRLASVPVVAMSADGSARAAAIASDAFIAKPFSIAQLTAAIDKVLSSAQFEQLRSERLAACVHMATMGMLTGSVLHDLNNPLTTMIAMLELIGIDVRLIAQEAGGSVDLTEFDKDLHTARAAAGRVRSIMNGVQLVAMGHDDAGPVIVQDVVEACIRIASAQFRQRARIVRNYAQVPPVAGSAWKIGQVILTLLVNAGQAIQEGGTVGNEVRVSIRPADDGCVRVAVEDTGAGMSAETQARLFEPFFTTKGADAGSGLGLFVARRLCQEWGGDIDVHSTPGVGSTFGVTLRVHAPREEGRAAGADPAPPGAPAT